MTGQENGRTGEIEANVLFERVREWVTRFVSLGDHEANAIALWVMMTHVVESFDFVAYLSITSAEKQCGKSTLLEVLEFVVARGWLTTRGTPAVLLRRIARDCPTLLLDESDAAFKGPREYVETLRSVLNAGYRRPGNQSFCVPHGKGFELVDFPTFCPKAIAGIGSLPDTVADRSIPVRLTRKLASENVERFRRRLIEPEASALRAEIELWAKAFHAHEYPEPRSLDDLSNRAADICEPLMMIAEACGDEVAPRAREALVALCGRQREDESLRVRLLADIRAAFDEDESDRIASVALASRLAAIEESPWGPRFGRDFDPRALARLLKDFEIKPRSVRLDDGSTPKGYHRDDFADAWARFLSSPEKPPQAPQAPQANKIGSFAAAASATTAQHETIEPPQRALSESEHVGATWPPQACEPQREKPGRIRPVADVADVAVPGDGRVQTLGLFDAEIIEEGAM
jgi:hypothetical protein